MFSIIDKILAEVCLDQRISDGIFDLSNNTHMEVLRENLTDNFGISLENVREIHNKMLEGKFPERQAYNRDGLLVTFPTPEHKAKAIQRGTHFEKDPSKGPQNVFVGGQQPNAQPAGNPPSPSPATGPTGTMPNQNIFPQPSSTSSPLPSVPASSVQQQGSQLPASSIPAPKASPEKGQSQSSPSTLPPSDVPPGTVGSDTQGLDVEPPPSQAVPGQQAPAPPPNFDIPKSSGQRASEAAVVKQIMQGTDTNPTLLPSLTEERNRELVMVYCIAKERGYNEAAKVLAEAMKK